MHDRKKENNRKEHDRQLQLSQISQQQMCVDPNNQRWQTYGTLRVPEGVEVAEMSMVQQVQLVDYIRGTGQANVLSAQIPIKTGWNIRLLSSLAESRSDREVMQYLLFGWPINHDGCEVTVNTSNHGSALRFVEHVDDYVQTELKLKCLLGPFATLPWKQQVAVSPMSTRPKKASKKR